MTNQEVAKIFSEISLYLEMNDVPWKPRAYAKVAEVVVRLTENLDDIYARGGLKALKEIPGVGQALAEKIKELLLTGRLKYYEDLKKKTPVKLGELTSIEGLGPKSIKKLYQKLGIQNLADLERAVKAEKIRNLAGFGVKTEENILKGIRFVKRSSGRWLLGLVMPEIRRLEDWLGRLPGVKKLTVAGSVRRHKETIGDADILIIAKKPKPVMDYFVRLPEVQRVYAHGETKSAVKLKSGLDVDLRVVPAESYGAALNYFTGSKSHNVALRQLAVKKGWKLNEYGLFKGLKSKVPSGKEIMIAGQSEEELYQALGLDYIEPELRENMGEIEAARTRHLPNLVGYQDLRGDLQTQTNWTDGTDSIEAMAKAASQTGLNYIAITDHTKRLAMTHGLDEKRITKQMAEIDRLNRKLKGKVRILKGTECDILKNGTLDLPNKILSQLDVVGASIHSHFNLSRRDQTARLKRAMANPYVHIIFHPTGRLIQKREAYEIDMDEVIAVAKKTNTVLEVNGSPERLDLKDEYIKNCLAAGVKLCIDSDAHAPEHFSFLEYGIAQARRGWAEKKDIINAWPVEKMMKSFKTCLAKSWTIRYKTTRTSPLT